jgi:hypothetical protein
VTRVGDGSNYVDSRYGKEWVELERVRLVKIVTERFRVE